MSAPRLAASRQAPQGGMRNTGAWALAVWWRRAMALGMLGLSGLAWGEYTLRDDLQRDVRFERPPARVLTMLPSLTETVCALGECQRLVGTDRYSNWPEQVLSLPKAGGLDDAQIELIVSLRPDVVLLARSSRVTDRLAQLGIRTFALETSSYAGIAQSIDRVAQVLGVSERAVALNQRLAQEVEAIGREARAKRAGRTPPSVYFEVDAALYAAGESSFIGELLTRLGARNIVPADLGPFPKLNPEFVVQRNPDVMLVSPQQVDALAQRPGWGRVRAVREQRVCSLQAAARDAVVRPGPRVTEGMRALAECLDRVSP